MRSLPFVVALMIALGACGQAPDQGSPPIGRPVSTAPTSGVPQGAVLVPDERVDAPSHYRERKVWVLNEGRTLQLTAMARDACTGVTAMVIEQNDKLVHVRISQLEVPQGGSSPPVCAQVLTPKLVTVDLKVPLGNRQVIISEASA